MWAVSYMICTVQSSPVKSHSIRYCGEGKVSAGGTCWGKTWSVGPAVFILSLQENACLGGIGLPSLWGHGTRGASQLPAEEKKKTSACWQRYLDIIQWSTTYYGSITLRLWREKESMTSTLHALAFCWEVQRLSKHNMAATWWALWLPREETAEKAWCTGLCKWEKQGRLLVGTPEYCSRSSLISWAIFMQ